MNFRALKRVQELVAEYERLKKEESDRRATYKTENTELEDEINKLEVRINAAPDENTDENEKMKQMEEQYQLVADKLQKQRLVMVKKQINSHFQTKTKTKSFIFL